MIQIRIVSTPLLLQLIITDSFYGAKAIRRWNVRRTFSYSSPSVGRIERMEGYDMYVEIQQVSGS